MFKEIEQDHPHMQETLLTAMGNLNPARMLDPRYLDLDGDGASRRTGTILATSDSR